MATKKKLPPWLAAEFTPENLRGIRSELQRIQLWADGYNAAKGTQIPAVPGSGTLGGPNRAIVLINRLLDADRL